MTTVATMLNLALRDAGVLGEGETASSSMMADTLETLGQLLAMWQVENLNVYAKVETSFSPSGATSYTVGSGGDVSMTRPDHISAVFYRSGGLDFPIELISTFEEWETIVQKTETGEPAVAFYQPSYPLGTLYLYPQPDSGTVHIVTKVQLPSLTASTDTITLPPEYIMPLRFSMVELICAMYNLPVSPEVARIAVSSRKILKRNNVRIPELGFPEAIPNNIRSNIFAG